MFPSVPPGALTHADITAWPATESCHPAIVSQSPLLRNRTKYSLNAWQESTEEHGELTENVLYCWLPGGREGWKTWKWLREQISGTCAGSDTVLRRLAVTLGGSKLRKLHQFVYTYPNSTGWVFLSLGQNVNPLFAYHSYTCEHAPFQPRFGWNRRDLDTGARFKNLAASFLKSCCVGVVYIP